MTSQPDRTPLELVAFAAWVNCPVDKLPENYKQHTCEATMVAWRRVVEAIQTDLQTRLASMRETFCYASPGSDEEFTSLLFGFDTAVKTISEKPKE